MSKRTASFSGRGDAKRAKVELDEKIDAIIAVLDDDAYPHDVPKKARSMLAVGARSCLGQCVEERHVVQDTVLGHVRATLEGLLEGLKIKAADEKRATCDMEAQLAVFQTDAQILAADVENTAAALGKEAEKAAQSKEACDQAGDKVQIAEVDEMKLFSAKDKLDRERAKYTTLQERLEAMITGDAESSKDSAAAVTEGGEAAEAPGKSAAQLEKEQAKKEKDAQKVRTKLVSDLKSLGADPTCLASAENVLQKKPEERQGFDALVVKALRDFLAEKVNDVDERLTANATETTKAGTELQALREVLAAATATKDSDAAAEATAQANHDAAVHSQAAKEKAIKDSGLEIKNHQAMAVISDSNVADFEGLFGTFGELCSRSSAPAPAEEPAEASVAE